MNSNMDIYMENRLYLSAPYFVMDDKKIYFSNRSFNALVTVDRETWNVESLVPFMGEELEAKELHLVCYRLKNKIYFLPQGTKKLHVYDLKSRDQKVYEMEGKYEGAPNAVWNFHVRQDKIYLLPCGGGMGLWSLDDDGKLCKENWWEVNAGTTDQFVHATINEQSFFSIRWSTRELTITDLENRETRNYQLPDEKVAQAAYDGQDFWYITYNSADIVRWNPEYGERERYPFTMWDKDSLGEVPYIRIYAAGEELFVVSGTCEELFLLDKNERMLKQVFQLPDLSHIYKYEERVPILTHIDDKLIWTFLKVNMAVVIDLKTMEGKLYQDVIPINEKVRDYFDRLLFQNAPLFIEDRDDWDLERFLYHCESNV